MPDPNQLEAWIENMEAVFDNSKGVSTRMQLVKDMLTQVGTDNSDIMVKNWIMDHPISNAELSPEESE